MLRPLTRWDMKEGHTYAALHMQENRAHLSIQEMTKSRVVPRFSWQFSHAKPQTAHRLAQTSAKKKSPPHHHCPLTAYAARRTHTAHCAPMFAIVFHGPPLHPASSHSLLQPPLSDCRERQHTQPHRSGAAGTEAPAVFQSGRPVGCQWRARAPIPQHLLASLQLVLIQPCLPHAPWSCAPRSHRMVTPPSARAGQRQSVRVLSRHYGRSPRQPHRAHQHAARPGRGGRSCRFLFWCCCPSRARARGRAARAQAAARREQGTAVGYRAAGQNRRARRAFFLVLPPGAGAAARPGGFQPAGRRRSGITTVPCSTRTGVSTQPKACMRCGKQSPAGCSVYGPSQHLSP